MDRLVFNGDLFRLKSLEDYVAFQTFYNYVKDENAVTHHIKSHEYVGSSSLSHFESSDLILLAKQKAEDISRTLIHFGNLTIISLCTTFEVTIKDFLRCYFFQNPHNMHNFIGVEGSLGTVPLKDLLAAESHQEFLLSLAERAASKASKGKYNDVFIKVNKLFKQEASTQLTKGLTELQKYRNRIVHEKFSKNWTLEEISAFESVVSDAIEAICRLGMNKGIPGSYTCVNGKNVLEVSNVGLISTENTDK